MGLVSERYSSRKEKKKSSTLPSNVEALFQLNSGITKCAQLHYVWGDAVDRQNCFEPIERRWAARSY